MPEDAVKLTPTVLWAQRKDRLLITIDLPNPEHPRVNLEEEGRLTFSATAGKDGEERREYEVVLEFLHPVNAKDSKISVGNRQVFVVVMKTEEFSGEHWPRLLRAKGKVPHVKTDFNKWVDEDEEEESDRDAAFDLAQLRELSTYEHSTYEKDFYGEEEDSDEDDDMPDLERI
ncbi:predicted protein [Micromonas commoda]|uniref:CS domain-containing protein n=1 Tax=Micromonas commoda (strain RCC299 / NOUM17 / CCMP2709) TaxID=296587 RepID=C1EFF5_MICCC|nr:predicted protein [Micromonas commoda]ACO66847.1 predicted protein [Micromonas commoda]|eukprot:XP_002505589.1 predicted protein [Micromonas commoda]